MSGPAMQAFDPIPSFRRHVSITVAAVLPEAAGPGGVGVVVDNDSPDMGRPDAGSVTAGLFLQKFVDGLPWSDINIAGTRQLPAANTGRNRVATSFGTPLLAELAVNLHPADSEHVDGSENSSEHADGSENR